MTGLLNRHRTRWLLIAVLLIAVLIPVLAHQQGARAASGEVVLLDLTDQGFGAGTTVTKFNLAGKTVVRKTNAEWSAMTAADFAAFDAIVLADPTCVVGTSPIAAAIANASTWGSVVDGNVIIIGADEAYHQGGRGDFLMESGAAFSVAQAGKTDAYISLSCYYNGAAGHTAVPMLDQAFGRCRKSLVRLRGAREGEAPSGRQLRRLARAHRRVPDAWLGNEPDLEGFLAVGALPPSAYRPEGPVGHAPVREARSPRSRSALALGHCPGAYGPSEASQAA